MTDATTELQITDAAAKRIAYLMSQESTPNAKLRIAVDGGGCSGFQYKFDFESETNEEDVVIEQDGAIVMVDEVSLNFLKGSVVDYIDTMAASHFEIRNPNASASCGCGNSFAI